MCRPEDLALTLFSLAWSEVGAWVLCSLGRIPRYPHLASFQKSPPINPRKPMGLEKDWMIPCIVSGSSPRKPGRLRSGESDHMVAGSNNKVSDGRLSQMWGFRASDCAAFSVRPEATYRAPGVLSCTFFLSPLPFFCLTTMVLAMALI